MHWIFWLVLFVVFVAIEINTVQLVSIWFALGSIGAGIVSIVMKEPSVTMEIVAFVATSAIALIVTRPFVKKVTKTLNTPTNADSLIGQDAIVTEAINNIDATGTVTINGAIWTARTESNANASIPKGTVVTVLKINGVKLIVKPKEKAK